MRIKNKSQRRAPASSSILRLEAFYFLKATLEDRQHRFVVDSWARSSRYNNHYARTLTPLKHFADMTMTAQNKDFNVCHVFIRSTKHLVDTVQVRYGVKEWSIQLIVSERVWVYDRIRPYIALELPLREPY
jgi:hypothetical protein